MTSLDCVALGKRLRRARIEKGLTQEQVADLVGIAPSFLGHIERGQKKPSIETLLRIANGLEISMDACLVDSLSFSSLPVASHMSGEQREELANMVVQLLQKAECSS